jgi:hypothetical protein
VADHIVAVSRRVEERIATGLPTTVIPNGVDTALLARTRPAATVRAALGFHASDFIIGYVGRFSDENDRIWSRRRSLGSPRNSKRSSSAGDRCRRACSTMPIA